MHRALRPDCDCSTGSAASRRHFALVDDSPYGLTAAIHTASIHRAMRFAELVRDRASIVVNGGTHGSEPHMGFGGVKAVRQRMEGGRGRGARRLLRLRLRQRRHRSGAGLRATVAVLGAGGVGGTIAVRLGLAGNRVICIARGRDGGGDRARGAHARGSRMGRFISRPEPLSGSQEPVELLLVAVKAFGLAAALERSGRVPSPGRGGAAAPQRSRARRSDPCALGARVAAGSIGRLEAYRRTPVTVVQVDPCTSTASTQGCGRTSLPSRRSPAAAGLESQRCRREACSGRRPPGWRRSPRRRRLTRRTARRAARPTTAWRSLLAAPVTRRARSRAPTVWTSPAAQWEMIDACLPRSPPRRLATSPPGAVRDRRHRGRGRSRGEASGRSDADARPAAGSSWSR